MEVLRQNNILIKWFPILTFSSTFLTSPWKGGKVDSFFFQINKKLDKQKNLISYLLNKRIN